jgi:ribosomal protein S27E
MAKKYWPGKFRRVACEGCGKEYSAVNLASHRNTSCTSLERNRQKVVHVSPHNKMYFHLRHDKVRCVFCSAVLSWGNMCRHVRRDCKNAGSNVCETAGCKDRGHILTTRHHEYHAALEKEAERQQLKLRLAAVEKKLTKLTQDIGCALISAASEHGAAETHLEEPAAAVAFE